MSLSVLDGGLTLPRHLAAKMNYRPEEACEYLLFVYGLKYAPATLAKKRSWGAGPEYFKANNRCILYCRSALDLWAAETLGAPRSSTATP